MLISTARGKMGRTICETSTSKDHYSSADPSAAAKSDLLTFLCFDISPDSLYFMSLDCHDSLVRLHRAPRTPPFVKETVTHTRGPWEGKSKTGGNGALGVTKHVILGIGVVELSELCFLCP